MADYFTKLSFAFALPEAQARDLADYAHALNAVESEEDARVPDGWPDPEEFLHMHDNWIGVDISVEPEALDAPEGMVPVWVRDDAGDANLDLLVELLETAVERFDIHNPISFEWTHDCSKARLNAFGGGAAAIGRDGDGNVATRTTTTNDEVRNLTAAFSGPREDPDVENDPSF
jgi:hypothetical protein